jgi:prolycopene isomerase
VGENGGEILLRSPVRRILTENGRATGIVLENGQPIAAGCVLSNADALQTVHELVGAQEFPARYLTRLGQLKPSISALVAYLACDLPLESADVAHETFLFGSWDHDDAFESCGSGRPSWLSLTVPTLVDPTLAPPNEHLITLTTLVRHDAARWRDSKAGVGAHLLELAGRYLPDLEASVSYLDLATPRTLERYTRNSHGAAYGWEVSPAQVGPGRLGMATPVEGLYLVGHWTQPGGGVYGVVWSGVQAARTLLGYESESHLWDALDATP